MNGTFGDLGAFGPLKGVYTGSYLVRNINQQTDYSNYLRSGAGKMCIRDSSYLSLS